MHHLLEHINQESRKKPVLSGQSKIDKTNFIKDRKFLNAGRK